MNTLIFKCPIDETEFKLEKGWTKSDALEAQEATHNYSSVLEARNSAALNNFTSEVSRHRASCAGQIALQDIRISD